MKNEQHIGSVKCLYRIITFTVLELFGKMYEKSFKIPEKFTEIFVNEIY